MNQPNAMRYSDPSVRDSRWWHSCSSKNEESWQAVHRDTALEPQMMRARDGASAHQLDHIGLFLFTACKFTASHLPPPLTLHFRSPYTSRFIRRSWLGAFCQGT